MDRLLFCFISGAISSLLWRDLPNALHYIAFSICLLVSLSQRRFYLPAFIMGILWMASVGHWKSTWQLEERYFLHPVTLKGRIVSLVPDSQDLLKPTKFVMQLSKINGDSININPPLVLMQVKMQESTPPLKQGIHLEVAAKLKPAYGLANEGGFNYQRWLFSQGIQATGFVKDILAVERIDEVSLRQVLLDNIEHSNKRASAWLQAMGLGYRGGLEQSDWQLLQRTGTSHLLAISGLHLAMVAGLAYLLSGMLLTPIMAFAFDANFTNGKSWRMGFALICAWLYAVLSGFAIPTLRAAMMMSLAYMLYLRNIHWGFSRFMLVSITSFMIVFPMSLFSLSFWLSFYAIACIGFIIWRWPGQTGANGFIYKVYAVIRLQLILSLLMLPIGIYGFSGFSILAPLVNLFAIPIVTFVLLPLSLISILTAALDGDVAEAIQEWAIGSFDLCIRLLEDVPENTWLNVPGVTLSICLLLGLFFWLLLIPMQRNLKYLCGLFIIPLISKQAPSVKSSEWHMDVMDVGQGLAVLFRKNNQVLLYDTGPAFPSGFNMADAVLLPYLRLHNIPYISKLVISHGDNDHSGSLAHLQQKISIAQVITTYDLCIRGTELDWQGLKIEFMWPSNHQGEDSNNRSCVMRVSDGRHSILLPGDIEWESERQLVKMHREGRLSLTSDVLIAPHHGSNTSSSVSFILSVAPKIAVFSQGFLNPWGFPTPKVVARYTLFDIKTYSTSYSGQLNFGFNKRKIIEVKPFRQNGGKRWYLPALKH